MLRELLPRLKRKGNRSFLEKAQKGMEEWRKVMIERASRRDVPMKPQVIAHELGKRLGNNAIVSSDSGTITTWWARHMPVKTGQMHSVSGNLATMACGLPYTLPRKSLTRTGSVLLSSEMAGSQCSWLNLSRR